MASIQSFSFSLSLYLSVSLSNQENVYQFVTLCAFFLLYCLFLWCRHFSFAQWRLSTSLCWVHSEWHTSGFLCCDSWSGLPRQAWTCWGICLGVVVFIHTSLHGDDAIITMHADCACAQLKRLLHVRVTMNIRINCSFLSFPVPRCFSSSLHPNCATHLLLAYRWVPASSHHRGLSCTVAWHQTASIYEHSRSIRLLSISRM